MLFLGEGLVCRVGERLKQLPGTAVGLGEESRLNSTHEAAAGNGGKQRQGDRSEKGWEMEGGAFLD